MTMPAGSVEEQNEKLFRSMLIQELERLWNAIAPEEVVTDVEEAPSADYLERLQNLADLSNVPAARANLGVGSASDVHFNTINVTNASTSRSNLGVGSANDVTFEDITTRTGYVLSSYSSYASSTLGILRMIPMDTNLSWNVAKVTLSRDSSVAASNYAQMGYVNTYYKATSTDLDIVSDDDIEVSCGGDFIVTSGQYHVNTPNAQFSVLLTVPSANISSLTVSSNVDTFTLSAEDAIVTNDFDADCDCNICGSGDTLAFFNQTGNSRVTVSGSTSGVAALQNLLSALEAYGLIIDSST